MLGLDQEKILSGTPLKRFNAARLELEKDYTDSNAYDFFYTYCDEPLSFLLQNCRQIFSETYYGYDFFFGVLKDELLDPRSYQFIYEKIQEYLITAKKNNLPKEQLDKYTALADWLLIKIREYDELADCFKIASRRLVSEEFFRTFFDTLYDLELKPNDFSSYELDVLAEAIFSQNSLHIVIPLGSIFCMRFPYYTKYLSEALQVAFDAVWNGDPTSFAEYTAAYMLINKLMKSEIFMKFASNTSCINLFNKCKGFIKPSSDPRKVNAAIGSKAAKKAFMFKPLIASDETLVENVLDFADAKENEEAIAPIKYDNLLRLQSYYETVLDFLPDFDDLKSASDRLSFENAEDMVYEMGNELYLLEWEADGSPNPVLAKHIMTTKEREEEKKEKEASKKPLTDSLEDSINKQKEDIHKETEMCEQIKSEISKVEAIAPSANEDEKRRDKKTLDEAKSKLRDFERTAKALDYTSAQKRVEELKEAIKDADPMLESFNGETDELLDLFMEDDYFEADDKTSTEPKVTDGSAAPPKENFATKVQNKAMDHEAKSNVKRARREANGQALSNAAKAVTSGPNRLVNEIKSLGTNIDKWDENRRKEFMLKPGNRHRIFRRIKDVIGLGMIAHFKMAWIPMAALIRHCTNQRDARLRNELSREIDNEIRITEEKINDASAAGDQKSKYELMRIRDKLQAEKIRVRTNSKYL